MATRHSTAPARAGERSRSPSRLYAFPSPLLDQDGDDADAAGDHRILPLRPDTPNVRAPRVIDAFGELLSAVLIIAGGVLAYGFLPFG